MFERENIQEKDAWLMKMALHTSSQSHDPNTQVGAVIVDDNNNILSVGYNSEPNGFNSICFPWGRDGKPLDTKYLYVCHAELNAICNFTGSKKDLQGTKIYVTLFPCNECAKLIVQSGIKEVIYSCDKYANADNTIAAKKIFEQCGVNYRKVELEEEKQDIKTLIKNKKTS